MAIEPHVDGSGPTPAVAAVRARVKVEPVCPWCDATSTDVHSRSDMDHWWWCDGCEEWFLWKRADREAQARRNAAEAAEALRLWLADPSYKNPHYRGDRQ